MCWSRAEQLDDIMEAMGISREISLLIDSRDSGGEFEGGLETPPRMGYEQPRLPRTFCSEISLLIESAANKQLLEGDRTK